MPYWALFVDADLTDLYKLHVKLVLRREWRERATRGHVKGRAWRKVEERLLYEL